MGLFQSATSSVPEVVVGSCSPGSPRVAQRDAELIYVCGVRGHPLYLPTARGLGVATGLGTATEAPRRCGAWVLCGRTGGRSEGLPEASHEAKGKKLSPGSSF